jgi:hypothetical protein
MYDEGIIGMDYRPVQIVRAKVNWIELSGRYKIRKGFPAIIRRLENKGYLSTHGKSGDVCSLTQLGVLYVLGKTKGEIDRINHKSLDLALMLWSLGESQPARRANSNIKAKWVQWDLSLA